ncbi:UNVERIFIED_CONTAM: copper amine oxidase-like protein [Acetivibrio alkalicellulosi]
MKKISSVLIVIILLLYPLEVIDVFASRDIKVTINNELITFDVKPQIIKGRTVVPVRGIFEHLNAQVEWFEETRTVLVLKDDIRIFLIIDSINAYVNEELIKLDVPAMIVDGRTLVPLRFISESLGADVSWDEKNRVVGISFIDTYEHIFNESISFDMLSEQYQSKIEKLIGAPLSYIINIFGHPDRVDQSKYGFDWYIYNNDLSKYIMIGIDSDSDKVVGIYTNSKSYSLSEKIAVGADKELSMKIMGEPILYIVKDNTRYMMDGSGKSNLFNVNGEFFATIFYDIHEDSKVTSFLLIEYKTEKSFKGYYGETSKELELSYEKQIFDLANSIRLRHGKELLIWDEVASKVAKAHSEDMYVNDFFSHTNLKNESPFDRMKNMGMSFRSASENIASGQLCSIYAHEAWMNSLTGHRENILADFTYIGVGVHLGSVPFYTQKFFKP